MEAKNFCALRGATKKARPVASVVSLSPSENSTVTPGVRRPLTSRTASVARSPLTILRGSRRMRAEEAEGGSGGERGETEIIEMEATARRRSFGKMKKIRTLRL